MDIEKFYTLIGSGYIQNLVLIFVAVVGSVGILKFLNSSSKADKNKDLPDEYISNLKEVVSKVDQIEKIIADEIQGKVDFTEEDKESILQIIEEKLREESNEQYLKHLELKIKKIVFEEVFNSQIERSIERLREEKASSFRRGNFNLTIGVMISSVGGYIAYTFIQKLPTADNTVQLFSYTLPRLSFFMLMILLAFFFLNLYRKGMDDIKYYQNEITNMEAKYLSLQMAKSMNNHKLISSILEQLVKTERNFVLEKDQSTIELEKERISSNNANNTLQAVKDIFQSKK